MITAPYAHALNVKAQKTAPKQALLKQAPLFAGKDSFSFTGHAAKRSANPEGLKKLLLSALLLSGTAAAGTKGSKGLALLDTSGNPQIANTINSLVPGLSQDDALEILKRPPFAPTDKNVFNHEIYGVPKIEPVANCNLSEADVKSTLLDTLNARFGKKDSQVTDAMALFDDANLKTLVPDPVLRGALVNLKGTIGEASIDTIKGGAFDGLKFDTLDPKDLALALTPQGQTKPTISLNDRYRCEPWQLLSSIISHETNHDDKFISVSEERLAHAFDTLIHAQSILENPELIKNNSEFTQRLNTKLLGHLNTRDENGNVALYANRGPIFPGSTSNDTDTGFGDAFSDIGLDSPGVTKGLTSPGNSVLEGYLKKTTGQDHSGAIYGKDTEDVVNKGQIYFDPVSLVALAKVLKLDTGDIPKAVPSASASSTLAKSIPTISSSSSSGSSATSSSIPTKAITSDGKRSKHIFGFPV